MSYLGKSRPVKSPLIHLRNFIGLVITMFLQWSHCFSEPMIYCRTKTKLITSHPSMMIDKRHDKNGAPTFNFFELSNEGTLRFSQGHVPNQKLVCGKVRAILQWWRINLSYVWKNVWGEPKQRTGCDTIFV